MLYLMLEEVLLKMGGDDALPQTGMSSLRSENQPYLKTEDSEPPESVGVSRRGRLGWLFPPQLRPAAVEAVMHAQCFGGPCRLYRMRNMIIDPFGPQSNCSQNANIPSA
jgi:hypothetical protein